MAGHVLGMGAAGSDQERFTALFRQHYDAVLHYAQRRTSDGQAGDVTAEVFLTAWRRLGELPPEPLPWLIGTARRVLANQRRGRGRADALQLRLQREGAAAEVRLDERVSVTATWAAAMRRLSDADHEILTLLVWDGLTAREAGVFELQRSRLRHAAASRSSPAQPPPAQRRPHDCTSQRCDPLALTGHPTGDGEDHLMSHLRDVPPTMADRLRDLDPVRGAGSDSVAAREAALAQFLAVAQTSDVGGPAPVAAFRSPRPRRGWLPVGAAGAVVAVVAVASLIASHHGEARAPGGKPTVSRAASAGSLPGSPQLTGRLVLDLNQVRAGNSVKGALIVTNRGGKAITRCRPEFYVVLTPKGQAPEELPSRAVCSREPLVLKPGLNRLPISVSTTYATCSPEPQANTPRCIASGTPPLPPGRYEAVLMGSAGLHLAAAKPVDVVLTPSLQPHDGCTGTISVAVTDRPPQILAYQELVELTLKVGDAITVASPRRCGAAITVVKGSARLSGDSTGHRYTARGVGVSRLYVTHGACPAQLELACRGGIVRSGAIDVIVVAG